MYDWYTMRGRNRATRNHSARVGYKKMIYVVTYMCTIVGCAFVLC